MYSPPIRYIHQRIYIINSSFVVRKLCFKAGIIVFVGAQSLLGWNNSLILVYTYYSQNYSGIIGTGLVLESGGFAVQLVYQYQKRLTQGDTINLGSYQPLLDEHGHLQKRDMPCHHTSSHSPNNTIHTCTRYYIQHVSLCACVCVHVCVCVCMHACICVFVYVYE